MTTSTAVVPTKAKVTKGALVPSAAALAKFEEGFAKTFGTDTLRRTDTVKKGYEVISTGSVSLDMATGVGGYVEGRIHELWGPESIGKTFLALLGVIEAQRKHPTKMVFFIDMEQTLDVAFAAKLGVDLSRMYHVQPDSAEDVADILKTALESNLISFVVVDSIGGMVTEEEMEKDAEKDVVGTGAKVITRMVKIASVKARQSGAVVLIINQVRARIAKFGPETDTAGGFALKHVTTMKFKMSRTAAQAFVVGGEKNKQVVGYEIAVTVEKNKVAAPKRTAIFSMCNQATDKYGPIGVDRADEAATVAITVGVVKRRGAKYDIPVQGQDEPHTVTGAAAVVDYVRDNPEVRDHLRNLIIDTRAGEVVPDSIDEKADVISGIGTVNTETGEVDA